MPNALGQPTLLDIATINGCDATRGLVEEVVRVSPELDNGFADTIPGIHFRQQVRTAYGRVGFRAANEGTPRFASQYENRLFECFILNPIWQPDKAVADAYERGAQAFIAMEGIGMTEASMINLSSQFYYGIDNDPKGFPGVQACVDPSMVIDAGASGATKTSSIWAVRWGVRDCGWLWGLNGMLNLSAVKEVVAYDGPGNPYPAYYQDILARPGLCVASKWSVARIKNISVDPGDTTHRANDKLLGQLKTLFPDPRQPHMYFMTKEVREQIRESRTATNPTGQPAPTPTDFEGVPLYATSGISNTEAVS
jgi:hypothetical protein